MRISNRQRVLFPLSAALGRFLPSRVAGAQDATPDASPPAVATVPGLSVVASGLPYPRGMTWGADGTLYVGLAGDNLSDDVSGGTTDVEKVYGLCYPTYAGAVVRIEDGCGQAVATGLPAMYQKNGTHQGVSDVAFIDGVLYGLNDGGGYPRGHEDFACGLYAIDMASGGWSLAASFDWWVPANPVANIPGDLDPVGEPFAMIPGDGFVYVSESNSGQILKVYPNGQIERLVDLSEGHPVPTGPAIDAEGNLYVGGLMAVPYEDGAAYVYKITPDGAVETVWTGLTMVTSVAVGPDGALYALEMATGTFPKAPFAPPHSGKVVRQTGPDSAEDIVTGLDYPISLRTGPDGALYISTPALGKEMNGAIIRVDLSAPTPMAWDASMLPPSTCAPIPGSSRVPSQSGDSTPEAAATPVDSGAAAVAGNSVTIQNYAFSPANLSVSPGTTVTWTNSDGTPHTVTADDGSFDAGEIAVGATWSYTFTDPGVSGYHCNFHPSMKGTITVQS